MRRRAAKSVIDGRNDEIAARRKMSIEGAMREARLGHQRPDAHRGDAFLAKPRRSVRDDLVVRGILVPPGIASHDLLLYGCGPLSCDLLFTYRPIYDEPTDNAACTSARASRAPDTDETR